MIDMDWLSDRLVWILRCKLDKNPETPEVPLAGERVWGIFLDLNATRGSSGFGPLPIADSEIEAWSRLRREPVRPFELDIIRALDEAMLKAASQRTEKDEAPKASVRTLTPKLFDAIFGGRKQN